MLERIVKIKIPIQKALLDLNQGMYFTDEEFALISSIVDALTPIKKIKSFDELNSISVSIPLPWYIDFIK